MKLADISIRQPVFITMIMSAIVVVGLVAYSMIGVELLPDISLPIVAVTTVYQGASPEEVESQVTKPVEEAVSSLSGVDKVQSTSAEGVSVVIVAFKLETDPRRATTDVTDKVSLIRNKLPRDAFDPVIDRFDPSAAPIISFGVVAKSGGMSLDRVRSIVEDEMKPALERIDGVGAVQVVGGLEREVQVEVDFARLQSHNLSIAQVVQALRSENLNMPAGRMSEGKHELLLRTHGEFASVKDIENVIVATAGGAPISLHDLAKVTDGFKEQRAISRMNGKECVIFSVRKQSGTNTVAVAEGVRKRIAQLEQQFPQLDIRLSSDESQFIRDAKNDVMQSLIFGAIFASIVVFFSFGNFRNTLVTVAGLPVCIIGSFAVMDALGFTVNVITLLALSLSVGLLIDDAIVVRENIFRHTDELGKDPFSAAREGTAEDALAVTATTLTIVAVFLPVAFATGIVGKFMREFGVTVTAAVLISLFEAFTFAPVLSAYFFKRSRGEEVGFLGRMMKHATAMYDRLNDVYQPALVWSLKHRKSVLGLATLLFVGSLAIVQVVGTGGSPRGERNEFNINLQYAPGINLERADELTKKFEKILSSQPEITDVFTVVGTTDGAVDQAVLHVRLRPEVRRPREYQDKMRPLLAAIPGAKMTFQDAVSMTGAAASTVAQLPVQVNVRGADLALISRTAEELKNRLAGVPGLVDVSTSLRPPRPEIRVAVDRESASRLGVSTMQLASVVRTFIGGDVASTFRESEKDRDIRVQLQGSDREQIGRLTSLTIPTMRGTFVNLSQVAGLQLVVGPTQIDRENRSRQIVVAGNIAQSRSLGEVKNEVQSKIAEMKTPEGVTIEMSGQAQQMAESFQSLAVALVLAIIFIYMVLASQFGSFVQPFTIMLALPLAVIGAFLALLLTGKIFDMLAYIGLILLMGLVTKNSILLIDYINQGRRRGMSRFDAILSAGGKRLRPILMTSFAMILGMLPVALAVGTSSDFRVSMAVTVIGGLVSSTLLTLVVIPVVYTILDDITLKVRGKPSQTV
jgi:hydrophobe/amphiphile efflux-1 (HAE1) family protein